MSARVLVIGGTGNFGQRVCRLLGPEPEIALIVGSRDLARAEDAARHLNGANSATGARLDIDGDIAAAFSEIRPDIVIHTTGPFQRQDYRVAKACIANAVHYIDLADARDFVSGFSQLDDAAKGAGVVAISGASSVPCLSAAVADVACDRIPVLTRMDYGIATAQQTRRGGGATTAAVLSYAGKPFLALSHGKPITRHGWQGLRTVRIGNLPSRWMADCDIPDLALFPERYPALQDIRFSAGVEVGLLQFGLYAISLLGRSGILPKPDVLAPLLSRMAALFDVFGSDKSGFFMDFEGLDAAGNPAQCRFELVAEAGDGPYIPAIPAAQVALKLARKKKVPVGARPCLDILSLDALLDAMKPFSIQHLWR